MQQSRVTVNGEFVCFLVKHPNHYEIVFPPDVTYRSIAKSRIESVHITLDYLYGVGEWVVT